MEQATAAATAATVEDAPDTGRSVEKTVLTSAVGRSFTPASVVFQLVFRQFSYGTTPR